MSQGTNEYKHSNGYSGSDGDGDHEIRGEVPHVDAPDGDIECTEDS